MQMYKAIFLDRDGTINVDKNYLYRQEDFEFLPGVIEALKKLKEAGYLLIIITNQSGIARGFYTEADFQKLNAWMKQKLENAGAGIDAVYYCPHHPNAQIEEYRIDCSCRKPKTGLFDQATKDFDIDLDVSYAIGDRLRDCSICMETNCHGFVVGHSESAETIVQIKSGVYRNIGYGTSLLECCNLITENRN